MDVKVLLVSAFKELEKAAKGAIKGTELEKVAKVINQFAIYAAVASATALVPGIGSIITVIAQTGLVWGTYLKINKELGISMKDEVLKFIASAMITNMATNLGVYLVLYLGVTIITTLPFAGLLTVSLYAAVGYILIYASAILYFKLLCEVMGAKGNFDLDKSDDTKQIIQNVVKNTNLKEIVKEAKDSFDEKKKSGEFDAAMKNPKCPYCGEKIKEGQKFCSKYGNQL